MKISLSREALLPVLNAVASVTSGPQEKLIPILGHLLVELEPDGLTLTATDREVEMRGQVELEAGGEQSHQCTVPGKKLAELVQRLAPGSTVELEHKDSWVLARSGRGRYQLATLPPDQFPLLESSDSAPLSFRIGAGELRGLLEATAFSMAQGDVRQYLNGMLWDITEGKLTLVATDGHRLAMTGQEREDLAKAKPQQAILPRKGVLEMQRLLGSVAEDTEVKIELQERFLRLAAGSFNIGFKLLEGTFPEYQKVVPRGGDKVLTVDREMLAGILHRLTVIGDEKTVVGTLKPEGEALIITVRNNDGEEADEQLEADYQGNSLEINFNLRYLLDVLRSLDTQQARFTFTEAGRSALVQSPNIEDTLYVVMPIF